MKKPWRKFWLAAVSLAGMCPVIAGAAGAVGVVIDYSPVAEDGSSRFELRDAREKTGAPVRLGMPVKAGQFIYLNGNGFVTVQLSNGHKIVANTPGGNSVPDAKPMGVLERIFNSWHPITPPKFSESAASPTRGPGRCDTLLPLSLIAPRSGWRLVAGEGDILVAASGACPGYVAVLSADGHELARTSEFADGIAVLRSVHIEKGRHSVVLQEMGSREARQSIEGVERRPQMPGRLKTGDAILDRLGEALWLAQDAGAEWRLEAARMLVPLVDEGNPLAKEIARSLLLAPR